MSVNYVISVFFKLKYKSGLRNFILLKKLLLVREGLNKKYDICNFGADPPPFFSKDDEQKF